jgi:hypothetical protein
MCSSNRVVALSALLLFTGINVRLHAQSAPPTNGLQLWVKADLGVTTNATGRVEKWADQSGNKNDATQTDDSAKPTLVPNVVNGKPALRFDGKTNYLDVANGTGLDIVGDIASFAVIRVDDYTTYNEVWGKTAGPGGNLPAPTDWYLVQGTGVPQFYRGDGTGSGIQPAPGQRPIKANNYVVVGVRQAGTAVTHFLNGSTNGVGQITVTPADGGTDLKIGSREDLFTKMKGDIAELLIYNNALSDADIVNAQNYLRTKYGITNAPPTIGVTSPANNSTVAAPATVNVAVTSSDPDGVVSKVALQVNGSTIATATAAPYTFPVSVATGGTVVFTAVATDDRDAVSTTNITVTFTSASTPSLNTNSHLKVWLKGDAGTTAGPSGGVTAWADQSGNNNNATQADETKAPTVSSLNGKPALHFDGSDDFLDITDSPSISITGDLTVFYVARFEDFGGFRAVFAKTSGNQPQPFDYYLGAGSGVPSFLRGDVNADGASEVQGAGASGAVAANSVVMLGLEQAGTNVTHYLNGAPFGAGVITLTPTDMDTPLKIGSRDDFGTIMKGDIAEILIYDAALAGADLDNVQQYLAGKYSIPEVQLANAAPKVQLTAPAAGANVNANTPVNLTATASDTGGSVASVQFFANGLAVGTDATSPYSTTFNTSFTEPVTVTAVATDNLGSKTTSAAVSFNVTGGETAPVPVAGLALWLRPDKGISTNSSGAVTKWADSSGNGNDAVQTDVTKAPLLNAKGINGLPSLTFDGVDDSLTVANSPSVAIAGDITTFFVINVADYDTYRAVWAKTAGNLPAANDYYLLPNTGEPRFYHGTAGGAINQITGTSPIPSATFVSAGYELSGDTATHYLSGAENGSGAGLPPGTDSGGPLQIGTRADAVTIFKGDFAELLIWARALSETERAQVQDYLQKKYFQAPSNQPTLAVATGGNNTVVFSWPTTADGFALEASNKLGTGASWAAVTDPVVVLNGQNTVTTAMSGNARFFRLKK